MYSFESCENLIERGRAGRKKLENNTYLIKRGNCFDIQLHGTTVVCVERGKWTLNTGGWQTNTTKERINSYSPVRISQVKGVWYFECGALYFDGVQVDESGKILNPQKVIVHESWEIQGEYQYRWHRETTAENRADALRLKAEYDKNAPRKHRIRLVKEIEVEKYQA